MEGVHLILANPPWRQLRERAQKIQRDKKHVENSLTQSLRCTVQYRTGTPDGPQNEIESNTTIQETDALELSFPAT